MACLRTAAMDDGFRVSDLRDGGTLDLPWTMANFRRCAGDGPANIEFGVNAVATSGGPVCASDTVQRIL